MSLASCIFGVPSDATYRAIQGLADDTVMRLLAQGKHDALAVIFDRYQRIVYRIALQILRDPGEAEDVMQSVFIAILQTADKFVADRGTLRVWVLQHAYHLALNRRRYLNLRGAYAHSDTIDSPAPAESYAGMTRVDSRRLVQQGLRRAVPRLPGASLHRVFATLATQSTAARDATCGNGEESAYAQSSPPFDVIYLPTVSKFFDDQTPANMYFRADVVPGQPFWISTPGAPDGRALNTAAFSIPTFATPADSRQGTLGRNALRGFGAVQTDLSLRREFSLHERLRLMVRMDAFNIFNHPNFGYPLNNLTATGFGQPYSTLSQTLGSGNGFTGGFNPLYAVGGPRSMQASLKLQF